MPRTRVLRVDPAHPDPGAIAAAAQVLRRGQLLAFPTETVYGLGADALDPRAVRAIFEAKGRPADNPLIVHVSRPHQAWELAQNPPALASDLAAAFWPGPLTLVMECAKGVPPETTAGLGTVAVRIPSHPVALALLEAAGIPVAAPSANLSGKPSPTRAEHVLQDLEGRIDAVLDGGETGVGVESTVLDLTADPPLILRPGGVSREELQRVIGRVGEAASEESQRPRSPGLKYRHYAPRARAVVVHGSPQDIAQALQRLLPASQASSPPGVDSLPALGRSPSDPGRVACLVSRETAAALPQPWPGLFVLGSREEPQEAARLLYRALREVDGPGVELIVMEAYDEAGIGRALMDRMRRAAGGREVDARNLGFAGPGESGEGAR